MSAEFLVGLFVSPSLQVIFGRMASPEVVSFFKGRRLIDKLLLKKLVITLISVKGILDDAKEKQITKSAVSMWLKELEAAVCKACDLMGKINAYEDPRTQLETGSQTIKDQLQYFSSSYIPFKEGMKGIEAKLRKILDRLEYLVKQKDALGLIEGIGQKPSSQKLPTTSLVDESGVYGRNDDKEALINLVLSDDDANGSKLGVIAIVGTGGVGKTTLAQLVYNDNRVQEWFDVRAWVCVSEEFDLLGVTKDILKELGLAMCDNMTANQLQLELKKSLMDKKFLLVLDDVCNDKYSDWDFLLAPLKSGVKGSEIIVTTRNESVASVMRTVPTLHLKELSFNDCWLVFVKHAFGDGNCSAHPELEVIGREIVRKCQGLPLPAKTLGGLLRSERDAGEWEKISNSNIWHFPGNDRMVQCTCSLCQLTRTLTNLSLQADPSKLSMQDLANSWEIVHISQQRLNSESQGRDGEHNLLCTDQLIEDYYSANDLLI